jgi:hypothetical protein
VHSHADIAQPTKQIPRPRVVRPFTIGVALTVRSMATRPELPHRAEQRLRCSHGDRDIGHVHDFQQTERVGRRRLDPDVSPTTGESNDVDVGREEAVEDRHGVVDAGVAVNDDAGGCVVGHVLVNVAVGEPLGKSDVRTSD